MNLNELAQRCHKANEKWWINIDTGKRIKRDKLELLALCISEVSECLEGERKDLMDDKLPHRKMAEVELADTKIRLLDFAGGFNIRLFKYKLIDPIDKNKGRALYGLMHSIIRIGGDNTSIWINMALAQIEAYAKKWKYDLNGAFEEKMAYNATREDHKHEARKIVGGKKW